MLHHIIKDVHIIDGVIDLSLVKLKSTKLLHGLGYFLILLIKTYTKFQGLFASKLALPKDYRTFTLVSPAAAIEYTYYKVSSRFRFQIGHPN